MSARWPRARRYQIVILIVLLMFLIYHLIQQEEILDIDLTRRSTILKDVERRLQEALKEDKGTGCQAPHMDPFDPEIMKYNKIMPKVVCSGFDWVRCHLSTCRVRKEILQQYKEISCKYEDIIYVTDKESRMGSPSVVLDDAVYNLTASDHVAVTCGGKLRVGGKSASWRGRALGLRAPVLPQSKLAPRALNVLILGYDSTSKNGFIRRMPKSYKTLVEDVGAVVLNSYNILGDGTPAALFPILTGKTELELPDRRKAVSKEFLDDFPFIFHPLREAGYRTAYFEDMPQIGTFQYRFNGFRHQPADHYLRHFYLQEQKHRTMDSKKYCVGDTPSYLLMLNATEQFFELDGNKFIFTFIADITHDDFNMITTADDDFSAWLKRFKQNGHLENTLLFVMGDHGPRFGKLRDTLAGKLEERLPLMAIRIPDIMLKQKPEALKALEHNANVLTTAHDVHATIMETLGLDYVKQSRAYNLFEKIPSSRSCSEAAIESHWCTCLKWSNVTSTEEVYHAASDALVEHINEITESQRSLCVSRNLLTTMYVLRHTPNKQLLKFSKNRDGDGYLGRFDANTSTEKEQYSVKLAVGPGYGVYEASMIYHTKDKKFQIDTRSISRINAYNDEPHCVSATQPHMNMYCYCKDKINN